jgi:signal transduction histidine kinase/CheY-like chemotaxis protein
VADEGLRQPNESFAAFRQAAELEARAHERTAQLEAANREKEELLRQLREADRRKDEFLAMLGHDLRNPLAPIRNALHVLRHRGDDPDTWRWARELMERQVEHLVRLVDELLDVSRITHGQILLRSETLDVARLVGTSVEDQRPIVEGVRVALRLELPAEPLWVRGDPVRLAQVVGNLLHNAGKFTEPGGEVSVRVARDWERARAVVTVRDTGIGINAALLPHVFEVFTQGVPTLDRSKGGLGLGLGVVKRLVELHGGEVRAASDGPGCGAEFTFWLPLEREPAPLSEQPTAAAPRTPSLRILVIEDNLDVADSLRFALETYGHHIVLARSGPEGIERAREYRPEVVLCDLCLPGTDGYTVAAQLKSDPATAATRLIAVTGYGREEDRRRCLEAGFDLHLAKPVHPEDLQRALAALTTP